MGRWKKRAHKASRARRRRMRADGTMPPSRDSWAGRIYREALEKKTAKAKRAKRWDIAGDILCRVTAGAMVICLAAAVVGSIIVAIGCIGYAVDVLGGLLDE